MDIVDFVMEWEQGDFVINDKQTLLQVIDFIETLSKSQGKYQRLLSELINLPFDDDSIYPIII